MNDFFAYLSLLFPRAIKSLWSLIAAFSTFVGLVALAVFGDDTSKQILAQIALALGLGVFLGRLLFLVPFELWREGKTEISRLQEAADDPLKSQRKWLIDASAQLHTSAKKLCREWSVVEPDQRTRLLKVYSDNRDRVQGLADYFTHQKEIYATSQDLVNRCDIVFYNAQEGQPSHQELSEAHGFSAHLLKLLTK